MKDKMVIVVLLIAVFLPCSAIAQPTPVEEKVGVLITAWGLSDGYDFGYAWNLVVNTPATGPSMRASRAEQNFPWGTSPTSQA